MRNVNRVTTKMRARQCVRVCVYVCGYGCMRVCVCVCVRERERGSVCMSEIDHVYVCVSVKRVWVRVHVFVIDWLYLCVCFLRKMTSKSKEQQIYYFFYNLIKFLSFKMLPSTINTPFSTFVLFWTALGSHFVEKYVSLGAFSFVSCIIKNWWTFWINFSFWNKRKTPLGYICRLGRLRDEDSFLFYLSLLLMVEFVKTIWFLPMSYLVKRILLTAIKHAGMWIPFKYRNEAIVSLWSFQ